MPTTIGAPATSRTVWKLTIWGLSRIDQLFFLVLGSLNNSSMSWIRIPEKVIRLIIKTRIWNTWALWKMSIKLKHLQPEMLIKIESPRLRLKEESTFQGNQWKTTFRSSITWMVENSLWWNKIAYLAGKSHFTRFRYLTLPIPKRELSRLSRTDKSSLKIEQSGRTNNSRRSCNRTRFTRAKTNGRLRISLKLKWRISRICSRITMIILTSVHLMSPQLPRNLYRSPPLMNRARASPTLSVLLLSLLRKSRKTLLRSSRAWCCRYWMMKLLWKKPKTTT